MWYWGTLHCIFTIVNWLDYFEFVCIYLLFNLCLELLLILFFSRSTLWYSGCFLFWNIIVMNFIMFIYILILCIVFVSQQSKEVKTNILLYSIFFIFIVWRIRSEVKIIWNKTVWIFLFPLILKWRIRFIGFGWSLLQKNNVLIIILLFFIWGLRISKNWE